MRYPLHLPLFVTTVVCLVFGAARISPLLLGIVLIAAYIIGSILYASDNRSD